MWCYLDMTYFVIISVITCFAVLPFVILQSSAQCLVNEDWSSAPCFDGVINGCYDSEDIQMWDNYYSYKGESIMELKRIELFNAIDENKLNEWISQSHENSNVWEYYYLKGESPDLNGLMYQCDELNTNESFTVGMNQSVFYDGYEIMFSEVVEDSRCPIDVTCIWEGRVSIKLDVRNEKKIQEIILTMGERATSNFDLYGVDLIEVSPYPISTRNISVEEYSATINIFNINENISPPLKQFKSGIPLNKIQCRENFTLIQKYDSSPACVFPNTAVVLIKHGWSIPFNDQKHSQSFSELESAGNSSFDTKLISAPKTINGKDYLVFEGSGWHGLHNVEITISTGDANAVSVRSHTNENGVLHMLWPIPENFSRGKYLVHATDGIHQHELVISIPSEITPSLRPIQELEVDVSGEKQVRRGTTHFIDVHVTRDEIPVDDAQVFIRIEDYGEDIIREFNGRTNHDGYFVFSWEIPKKFDDIETLLAFVDVTDGISSKTVLFKFQVYCIPGEKDCKVKGN